MRRTSGRVFLGLLAVPSLAGAAFIVAAVIPRGGPAAVVNDPWQVTMAYVAALNHSDPGAVHDLVVPGYHADIDIRSRIDRLGGRDLHCRKVTVNDDEITGPGSVDLVLEAPDQVVLDDSFPIALAGNRWYLRLGNP